MYSTCHKMESLLPKKGKVSVNVMKEAGPGLFEFEGPTHDLFLGVLVRRKQVHGLDVAEVDVVAEQEDEEQLANVLLLLIAV